MRFLTFLIFSLLTALGFGGARAAVNERDVYGHDFRTLEGGPLPLAQFRGKVLLVVNTASECGFTRQYAGLQKLYEAYRDQGLVVLGVPSNDFGNQEPGTDAQIKTFCETHFGITFPMAGKEVVTGERAHPFFRQVREDLGLLAAPRWNFYKYLVNRDGKLVDYFPSATAPDSDALKDAIEKALGKKL